MHAKKTQGMEDVASGNSSRLSPRDRPRPPGRLASAASRAIKCFRARSSRKQPRCSIPRTLPGRSPRGRLDTAGGDATASQPMTYVAPGPPSLCQQRIPRMLRRQRPVPYYRTGYLTPTEARPRAVLAVGLKEMLPSVPLAHQVLHLLDHFQLADILARAGVRRQRVLPMYTHQVAVNPQDST